MNEVLARIASTAQELVRYHFGNGSVFLFVCNYELQHVFSLPSMLCLLSITFTPQIEGPQVPHHIQKKNEKRAWTEEGIALYIY